MSYENPIVCREVYIPYPLHNHTVIETVADYKEIFGIDLHDIFDFRLNTAGTVFQLSPKRYTDKLYLVCDGDPNSFAKRGVQPLLIADYDNPSNITFYVLESYSDDEPYYSFITINLDEEISIGEF